MSTSITLQPQSRTLATLGLSPKTACAGCQNAVWHVAISDSDPNYEAVRIYCKVMHVLVDEPLKMCDGAAPAPAK